MYNYVDRTELASGLGGRGKGGAAWYILLGLTTGSFNTGMIDRWPPISTAFRGILLFLF
jgi:hypothetical protein